MSKNTTLHGSVKFKEITLSEDLTARILAIDTNGNLVDRPAIGTSGFITTALADGRVWIGSAGGVATAVDTASVGDIDADSVMGLTIKAGTIVDADINGGAAISKSKLNLAGTILNADINAAAAIAYSKLTLTNSIVNADIAAAAAIVRTKIATGNAYRILANTSAGVMSENAAITADRAVISDANGQLTQSATTAAQIGYSSTLTGDIQSQLDNEIATKTVNAIVKAPTVAEHGYAITWNNTAGEWTLTDPVTQGIPLGGTTRQVLAKVDGSDWNADWMDLVLSDITDVSAVSADLNLLAGAQAAGLTSAHLSYLIGVSSSIQNQLDGKQSSSLAQNAIWVGNGSSLATPLAAGTSGYVLTSVGGVPTWAAAASGGSPPGANTQIIYNSAGAFGADAGFTYDASTDLFQVTGQTIFTANDGATNSVTTVLALTHTTTGAPAVGIGTGISFSVETAAGNNELGALLEVVTTDVTAASEDFDIVFKAMAGGAAATEVVRMSNSQFVIAASGTYLGLTTTGGTNRDIIAQGSGADVGIQLNPKGAGAVELLGVGGGLHMIQTTTSSTNTAVNSLKIATWSSGVPATGLGAGLEFEVGKAGTTLINGASIQAISTDFTGGSEDFKIVFKTMTGGAAATEKFAVMDVAGVMIDTDVRIHGYGNTNVYIGPSAGNFTLTGTLNTTLGSATGSAITTASSLTLVGAGAGQAITTGGNNTALGYIALGNTTTGAGNVGIGYSALAVNVTGGWNIAIGQIALNASTGDRNIGIGKNAGDNLTAGDGNVIIGGQDIDFQSATGSNQLVIQNAIFGNNNGASGTSLSTGNLGFWATTWGTGAQRVIALGNGNAPSTSIVDGVQIYAEDVAASSELKVRDEAGNITTLSPHNFSLIGEPSEELAWSYFSERDGKQINVDMLALVREVEKLSGRKLVHTNL